MRQVASQLVAPTPLPNYPLSTVLLYNQPPPFPPPTSLTQSDQLGPNKRHEHNLDSVHDERAGRGCRAAEDEHHVADSHDAESEQERPECADLARRDKGEDRRAERDVADRYCGVECRFCGG
jgi:hypothetical protein